MSKRILALFCALSICFSLIPGASALEGEARRAADTLITLGLLAEADADYDMSQPANRFSAAVMLSRLSDAEEPGADFPNPAASVTASEWFLMLLQTLGYREGADFTSADAAVFARRIGLSSRAYTGMMTFGDLCESAQDALRFPYKDGGVTVVGRLVENGICSQSAVNALGLNNPELTARQISDRYMSAVFSMILYDVPDPIDEGEPYADASGFFISPDGLAVTNYHSIEGAAQAVATLVTGESCMVERVVWYDVEMDLAVIRVSRTTVNGQSVSAFACLELVGTEDLRPGDIAYTLSNPLGLGLAVSSGVISATARKVERYSLPCVMNTADISQGSSGGALLNVYGHVVAVTSGAYRVGNSMYLAVPVDIVKTLDLTGEGETLQAVSDKELQKSLEKQAESKEAA
ncbi:MAG: serine protease [Oscillibacter sp.]|nr:serine protease [Oscillibacter sp.]